MEEPEAKRRRTILDETESEEVVPSYGLVLEKIGKYLTKDNVEALATIAELTPSEKDQVTSGEGNGSRILFKILEQNQITGRDDIRWLQRNLRQIKNEMAAKLIDDFISCTEKIGELPSEPEYSEGEDEDGITTFENFLEQVGLKDKYPGKLKLKTFLQLGTNEQSHYAHIFWQMLSTFNYRAGILQEIVSQGYSMRDFIFSVLHCCDDFLRQDVLEKMSACQLAVPLVLQGVAHRKPIFLLWAVRRIIKKWRGESDSLAIEQPIVNYPVFNISFLRIGDVRVSKSQLINTMLSYSQGYPSHTFFLNREKDFVVPRFSPGSVECVWFLPMRESENQILKEVTAFFNLRGDCTKYPTQTQFACKAAHLTVALITTSKHKNYTQCISQIKTNAKSTLFISISEEESRATTSKKVHRPKYKDGCLFVNVVQMDILSKTICEEIVRNCKPSNTNKIRLESLVDICSEDIETDEQKDLCRKARLTVCKIFEEGKAKKELDVLDFKENSFPLQTIWKDWVEADKAPLQTETEVHETLEHQMESKRIRKREKRELQLQKNLSMTMQVFLKIMKDAKSNSSLLQYIFGFMQEKIYLLVNEDTRNDLNDIAELEREIRQLRDHMMTRSKGNGDSKYDEQGTSGGRNEFTCKLKLNECSNLYRNCRAKNLGCEHFLRELGQLYEAWVDLQDVHAPRVEGSNTQNVTLFPSLAAGLVTEMQSLEIMDGDTGCVPLTWVTSVLDTLTTALKDPTVLVLSVIGVQSSGKSTLLNSMFGVRFPVRSGRCTRGLFIQLLKLSDKLSEELGFHYLVVVDSEGIRSIDYDDRKFDNKLVTLALSIANVTIFNIEGENIGPDMTGILQIAAHALMRMKELEVDLVCHCRIVQQRVSDMTAGDRNKTNTKKIQEILDKATRFAAEEEGLDELYKQFSDVVDLRVDEDLQYIPCLWAGGMAPPNHLYSETVSKLKDKLFEDIKRECIPTELTLSAFTDRIRDVWKAIKEEDFVFNFHDSVKAVDYNKFLLEYNQWIAQMRQDIQVKIVEVLSSVHTEPRTEVLRPNITALKQSLKSEIEQQRSKLTMCVENHIANHPRRNTMLRYRQEFLHDIIVVLNETEDHSLTRISDEYEIKRISLNLPRFEKESLEILTREVKAEASKVTDTSASLTKDHFDVIWQKMIDKLRKDHNMTPAMITASSLQNICEKLLLKVTRDMAVGSEIQTLLSQEGGITNHLSLEDSAKYIGVKFVKSWVLNEISTKTETVGNRFGGFRNASWKGNASRTIKGTSTQNKYENHLEEEKRQQAITYLRNIVEKKLSHLSRRSKVFDANVFQLMLGSTLKELSTKHPTYNIKLPYRLIAKGLLSFCGRAVANIYKFGARDIGYNLSDIRDLVENSYRSFINQQNQNDAAAEFIMYYTAKIMDDKITTFREKLYRNVDHTQYSKHMHIPWDILCFVFTPYNFIEVYGFYDELLTAPLHDIVDLYVDSKREKYRKHIIEKGKEDKIVSYITDLVSKIEKMLSQATSWVEWCKLLGNFLSCPFIKSAGDIFRVADLSIVTGKLLDDLNLCYKDHYGTFESFYNSSFKNAVGLSYVCSEVCPMCGAWCDNILQSHTVHSSLLHRPRGLKGEKYPVNKTRIDFSSDSKSDAQSSHNSNLHGERYVLEDCCMSLTSDTATFEYEGKMVLCKNYQKLFPNWDIRPGKGNASHKLFWQYFFVNHYGDRACNIPQSWRDIDQEEAIQSLEWAKKAQLEKRKSMASIPL